MLAQKRRYPFTGFEKHRFYACPNRLNTLFVQKNNRIVRQICKLVAKIGGLRVLGGTKFDVFENP